SRYGAGALRRARSSGGTRAIAWRAMVPPSRCPDGKDSSIVRTLFLHPPSYDGFDGGAGARYQMKREVRSFWYPTWLAQPAALVEGSKLIDAPPHRLKFDAIAPELNNRDLVVMHTSTSSFTTRTARFSRTWMRFPG